MVPCTSSIEHTGGLVFSARQAQKIWQNQTSSVFKKILEVEDRPQRASLSPGGQALPESPGKIWKSVFDWQEVGNDEDYDQLKLGSNTHKLLPF